MLAIEDLYVGYYEDLHILRGLSLKAQTGKLTAILGRERRRQVHPAQGHLRFPKAAQRAHPAE